jgi:undecaprenyl-diphosphatase
MFPNWDSDLFKLINTHHSEGMDMLMVMWSNKYIWIPLYLYIIKILFDRWLGKKNTLKSPILFWKTFIYLILCVALADSTTSAIIKPLFERLRPCHVEAFQSWIHLPDGCGGMYGFCSSHAANSVALATCIYLISIKKTFAYILIAWAILVGYSRIYIGAHFPLDVLVGSLIGMIIAILVKKILYDRFFKNA